jgi:hypothetical protein
LAKEVELELARDAKEGKVMVDPNAVDKVKNNNNNNNNNNSNTVNEDKAEPEVLAGI